MKILWVNQYASFQGGVERYVWDMTNEMKEHQHYLLYDFEAKVDFKYAQNFEGVFPTVDVLEQVKSIDPDLIYIHNLRDEKVQEELNKLGIKSFRFLHDHKLFCPREHKYSLMNNKTCTKKYGLKCMMCCGFYNKQKKMFITPGMLDNFNNEVKKNHKVIVGSQYMYDQLLDYGYKQDHIYLIPLYSRYNPEEKSIYFEKHLTFIGSTIKGKGFDFLINSLKEFDEDIKLNIITTDNKISYNPNYFGRLDVTVHENKTSNEIKSIVKKSNVVVVPSISPETFSLVGIESLALSTKVIASNVGGMKEWSQSDGVFTFESGNKKDFLENVKKALKEKVYIESKKIKTIKDYCSELCPVLEA